MVTLDTISRFGGTGKMLLDAQGTGLESAGVMHRLKSFFNFGDARAKNAATLNAIRSAVLSDPRFAPADLQAQAQRLLDDVRTDRAIDASQIKGLVKALKKLAENCQEPLPESAADDLREFIVQLKDKGFVADV